MTLPIDTAAGLPLFDAIRPAEGTLHPSPETGVGSFEEVFGQAIAAHSARAHQAAELAQAFAAGKSEDIHGTMIAIKEVEIELHVISNVRRKVVDAFQELWRMNV